MVPTEIKKPFAEPRRGKINGPLLPPDSAVGIGAGASYSMVAVKSGVTYFFGQTKSSGEATMYPKVRLPHIYPPPPPPPSLPPALSTVPGRAHTGRQA
jgi:hypothetical protein